MKEYITYEMFGAAGDGIRDDMPAIVKAHAEANIRNIPVKAKEGACYYISPKALTAVIMTDTDWTGAKFVIDDRGCEDIRAAVFCAEPTEKGFPADALPERLFYGQEELRNPWGRDVFLIAENDEHRDFIRRGLNQNNGHARTDCFVLSEDGRFSSPCSYDFEKVTGITVYPIDSEKLTICGGEFTTIANQQASEYNYHRRNIQINRSNTDLHHVTHYVTGEIDHGAPYTGFISIENCAMVHVYDCVVTGHYIYWTIGAQGLPVPMGSYDINCRCVADVTFSRCVQTTDIMDEQYWGIIGTNFCRDLVFEDCVFSRFDAHMGVTNCTLRRCRLGWQCLNAIGNGTFVIEDTEACGRNFVYLRFDYGCCWRGDIVIKNCTWKPLSDERNIIGAENDGTHDFGYECYITRNVVIDGLKIIEEEADDKPVFVFKDYLGKEDISAEERKYIPIPPESVKVKNIDTEREIRLCQEPALMPDTVFVID